MSEVPNIVFPALTPANQAIADVLAQIDDAREELPEGSADRAELDALHVGLDRFGQHRLKQRALGYAGFHAPPTTPDAPYQEKKAAICAPSVDA